MSCTGEMINAFVARNFVNGVLERERLIAEQEEVSSRRMSCGKMARKKQP